MTNAQRLGLASEHLLERSKSTPHSAELNALVLHQEVLENLVSVFPGALKSARKAPKALKSAKKKSPASATSPVTPAPDTAEK